MRQRVEDVLQRGLLLVVRWSTTAAIFSRCASQSRSVAELANVAQAWPDQEDGPDAKILVRT